MIYRGQRYGAPVGEWWTTSLKDAQSYAMSRGSNRTWVVLSVDEDLSATWLESCLMFEGVPCGNGETAKHYRIPRSILAKHWRGVEIVMGTIALEEVPPETSWDDEPTPVQVPQSKKG